MKFLVVLALCAAVASANLIGPISAIDEQAEIKEIIAAINSPSTDPATAAALQHMLNELLGLDNIAVGPAIIEGEVSPISVGPALIEEKPTPISVGPAIIKPIAAPASSPLVQIIVNVKSNSGDDVAWPGPAIIDEKPSPVIVVDEAEVAPEPVIVVDEAEVAPEPVIVVDEAEVAPEPVIVVDQPEVVGPSVPVIEEPSIVPLPGILN